MKIKLPTDLRPHNTPYRQCELGVDLPAGFIAELRSIDEHLYPVWHPYRVLWDDVINQYNGSIEDPRYEINYKYSELNFGYVLTNGQGCPTPEGAWHIWRLCRPHGWAHVINIDSRDTGYLNLLCRRLWLQAQYNDRYGHKGYRDYLEKLDIEARDKQHADKEDLMNEISKTNSGMMNRVRDNFERGITAPTNPTKESIMSFPGQKSHDRLVRPLDDSEGGIIVPETW
jgi:hypothetical protein